MAIIPYLNSDESVKVTWIENVHHIVPKKEGGTSHTNNKIKLYTSVHEALHRLFWTLPPHEQIKRIIDIAWTALQENFKWEIHRATDKSQWYIYKNWIWQK